MLKNRLPPDKLVKTEVQGLVIKDRLDGRISSHPGHYSSEVEIRNGSSRDDVVSLFVDSNIVKDPVIDELIQLSHELCEVVGGNSNMINYDVYREYLSSAEDEFGDHVLLGPLDKVLSKIPLNILEVNREKIKRLGLDGLITEHLDMRKQERLDNGGMSIGMLKSFFNEYPQLNELIDLVENGAKPVLRKNFVPNGLSGINKFSKSYLENIDVCNHTIAEGINSGQIIPVLLEDFIDEQLEELHFQSYELASKLDAKGKPTSTGRLCQNASDGGSKSRNKSIDQELMNSIYKPEEHTNGSKICELACEVRDRHPNDKVFGTMIDVTNAYGQNLQSLATAKTCCCLAKTWVDGVEKTVVCIYAELIFGGTEAGAAYAVTGRAIHWAHNRREKQSERYVDDHSLLNSMHKIVVSEEWCVRIITALFGKYGVNPKKLIRYEEDLISIGWKFNLRKESWKIMPKPKAIRKIFAAIFFWIRVGQVTVKSKRMESVLGILNHYLRVIPLAEASIKSLYACMDYTGHQREIRLSENALDDLKWLRAITLICMTQPELMCVSIDHLRVNPIVEAYIRTDAASTIGGGGALGDQPEEDSPVSYEARIRWTDLEMNIFQAQGVSINILELFAAIYHILIWGEKLRGKVVKLFCDNTAAVSWLNNKRGNSKAVGGIALLRVLSIYCMIMKIRIVSEHIPGVENIRADRISRELCVVLQDRNEGITEDKNWWKNLSRQDTCRKLLKIAIVQPELLHLNELLGVVRHLLLTPGLDTAKLPE